MSYVDKWANRPTIDHWFDIHVMHDRKECVLHYNNSLRLNWTRSRWFVDIRSQSHQDRHMVMLWIGIYVYLFVYLFVCLFVNLCWYLRMQRKFGPCQLEVLFRCKQMASGDPSNSYPLKHLYWTVVLSSNSISFESTNECFECGISGGAPHNAVLHIDYASSICEQFYILTYV